MGAASKYLVDREAQAETMDLYPGVPLIVKGHGVGLTDAMWAAVERTPIQVFYETPAHELILEGDSVLGVRARRTDGFVNIYGRVILACGGFEGNARMRRQYLGPGTEF
jgi:tricarballylate dehydrogenase